MCGIAGLLHVDGRPIDFDLLTRMTEALHHRGPDDHGYFRSEGVGLGFRRLSIIDLGGGHQPMPNEDGTVQIIFNGEIYNFRELRVDLERQGHVFRTASDTEVIVHGYEAWGDDVVQHLNGMFAFALWDSRRRRLLLARDRLGIKPLVYSLHGSTLAFASEIKSLLQLPGFDAAVNDRGVFDYFSYLYIPGPETIYREVRKLQPAEVLTVENGKVQTRQYWRPIIGRSTPRQLEDWCEELRQRLQAAVRLQLVADVPLGVFLSGGIDSSAITAAMARVGSEQIRSFTCGFDVAEYDETRFAAEVSRHVGTSHLAFTATAANADLLPKLLWYLDEPLADATIIPTYLLSSLTRRHVTVALSGEGGDELFAGYTHYQGMALNRRLQLLPRWLRHGLASFAGHLPRFASPRLGYLWHRLERVVESSLVPPFEDYTRKVAIFTPEQHRQLFSSDFQQQISGFPYLEALRTVTQDTRGVDPIAQACLADLSVYLPGDMLTKVDRMSMACSLEVRVPFLDHTLVEFVQAIPIDLKLKGMQSKYLLRQALTPWLPTTILHRPKRGFNPPLEFWLQRNLMEYAAAHHMMETLAETGYFNLPYIRELADAHTRGRRNYSRQLWALLVFAVWWHSVRGRGEMPI
jgi:asparagine synthase (glutamine-hydrolysing)